MGASFGIGDRDRESVFARQTTSVGGAHPHGIARLGFKVEDCGGVEACSHDGKAGVVRVARAGDEAVRKGITCIPRRSSTSYRRQCLSSGLQRWTRC